MFNNTSDFGAVAFSSKHNNLRVMSTPEFPVPYYQRIMRNPPAIENVTINLNNILAPVNEGTVARTKAAISGTAEGLKIIEHVENELQLDSYVTCVSSPAEQCDIYSDDLIHYLDSVHEENCRILKSCDISDCLN